VALEKGAVLLDTKTNSYVLQLKLVNLYHETVSEVHVHVIACDEDNNKSYEIINPYFERAAAGDALGTKTLLPIPNNVASHFYVYVTKAVSVDGGIYTYTEGQDVLKQKVDEDEMAAHKKAAAYKSNLNQQTALQKQRKAQVWLHILFAFIAAHLLLPHVVSIFGRPWSLLWSYSLSGFMVSGMANTFISLVSLPVQILFWILLISAWRRVSQPIITKRTKRMAIIMPLCILFLPASMFSGQRPQPALLGFMVFVIACVFPYLIVSTFGVAGRRTPQQKDYSLVPQLSAETNNAVEVNDAPFTEFCFHCGESVEAEVAICPKCGGSLSG